MPKRLVDVRGILVIALAKEDIVGVPCTEEQLHHGVYLGANLSVRVRLQGRKSLDPFYRFKERLYLSVFV